MGLQPIRLKNGLRGDEPVVQQFIHLQGHANQTATDKLPWPT
jgi:hypothetical protein